MTGDGGSRVCLGEHMSPAVLLAVDTQVGSQAGRRCRIVDVSPSWERLCGFHRWEVVGKHPFVMGKSKSWEIQNKTLKLPEVVYVYNKV